MNIFSYLPTWFATGMARWFIFKNDLLHASSVLQSAFERRPHTSTLLKFSGYVYWRLRKWEEALNMYRLLVREYPDRDEYKWNLGIRLLYLWRYEESLPYFQYCVERHPSNDILLTMLGICYSSMEKWDEAEKTFSLAYQLAPWNPDLLAGMIILYQATSRFEAIQPLIEDYLEKYPNLYPPYFFMGDHLQYRLLEPQNALSWYQQALALIEEPRAKKYLSHYAIANYLEECLMDVYCETLIKCGQKDAAYAFVTQRIAKHPHAPAVRTQMISYYLYAGDYGHAEQEARLAYQKNPNWPDFLPLLSEAVLKQGRLEEALEVAKAAVQVERENPRAWLSLGNAEMSLGNWHSAIDAYLENLKREPFEPDTLGKIAVCYLETGEYESALRYCQKRVLFDPKFAEAWLYLGQANYALKRYDAAKQAIQQAILLGNLNLAQTDIAQAILKASSKTFS